MTDKTIGVKNTKQARQTNIRVTIDVPLSVIDRKAIKNDSRLYSKFQVLTFWNNKVAHLQSKSVCGRAYTIAMDCILGRVGRGCGTLVPRRIFKKIMLTAALYISLVIRIAPIIRAPMLAAADI